MDCNILFQLVSITEKYSYTQRDRLYIYQRFKHSLKLECGNRVAELRIQIFLALCFGIALIAQLGQNRFIRR